MTRENTKKLFDRFDFFKPEKSLQETLMSFGFECGDGWFDLIWNLCQDIELLLALHNPNSDDEAYYPFEVIQVKEKFGQLRFYTNWLTDGIDDRISKAEVESSRTCELCGDPGSLVNKGGWLSTVCENCKK